MEHLNSVELRGFVGNVKYQGTKEKAMVIFSLCTSRAYFSMEGNPVIENTWHNVVAFEGKDVNSLDKVVKGSKIYVRGRLRNQKFTGADGQEHYSVDVLANRLVLIDDDDSLQCEM